MQCIILSGGLATRMRPLTELKPKALLQVGPHPFVHYQLEWLKLCQVEEVVFCIGYRGEEIRDYIEDGSEWGLDVSYVDEGDVLMGTAGALRLALEEGVLKPRFLVLYGDSFLPIHFGTVFQRFVESKKPGLMTVFKNDGKLDKSNVIYQENRVVLYDKYNQEPELKDQLKYIDYGLSCLNRTVIEDKVPQGKRWDLAQVYYDLSKARELAGIEVLSRFYEIGSPEGLKDFENFVENRKSLAPDFASQLENPTKTLSI